MVRPSQQRIVVRYLDTTYPISERRACRTVRCARATYRYQRHRNPRVELQQANPGDGPSAGPVRYGYRKIRVLLNREGWAVGKKLVYRLYREEGLTLRHQPPRRRKAMVARAHRPRVTQPNEVWTLDFVADQLANGQRIRALTVVDVYTRESLAIEVGQRLRSEHVVQVLNRLTAQRGAPRRLFCDNGSEFCSQLVDLWAFSTTCTSTSHDPDSPRTTPM